MKHTRMRTKKAKAWAVVDKNGDLLHRAGGSPSVFLDKDTADFLAYDWIDPKDNGSPYESVSCTITITNPRSRNIKK